MDNLKSSKHKKKYENDLLMLLNEADHIILDDLELDNILKEQSKILCNINEILNFENNKGKNGKNGKLTKNPLCEISNLNNRSKEIINIMPKKNLNQFLKPNSMKITKKKSKTSFANKSKSFKKSIKNSNSNKNNKIINKFSKKTNYKSMKNSIQKSKTNYKQITKKNLCKKTSKSRPITINKLTSRKKYIYKHNNKRKYDITITKPSIFIKQGKN
jgi:hypothetical protein